MWGCLELGEERKKRLLSEGGAGGAGSVMTDKIVEKKRGEMDWVGVGRICSSRFWRFFLCRGLIFSVQIPEGRLCKSVSYRAVETEERGNRSSCLDEDRISGDLRPRAWMLNSMLKKHVGVGVVMATG